MPRLIDAHDLWSDIMMLPHNGDMISSDEVSQTIMDAPTVDAVPVVRCKDCIYAKKNYLVNGLCLCEKPIHDVVKGETPRNTLMDESDFCSYGEKREV